MILVPLEQVVYLKAELKYITVRTREREFLIEESLTSLEEEFNDRFVRIHRNALVARPSIAGFERVTPTGEGEAGDPYWQVVLREITGPASRQPPPVVDRQGPGQLIRRSGCGVAARQSRLAASARRATSQSRLASGKQPCRGPPKPYPHARSTRRHDHAR